MSDNLVSHDLATSPIVQDNMVDIKWEEEKCRSVFPEEIWLQIADKTDFGAYWQLRESSPYFWDLLENAWNRWFPQFAEILYNQLRNYPKEKRHVMSKCRMVCRRWEESVDAVIQNLPEPLFPLSRYRILYSGIDIKRPFDVHLHVFSEYNNSITEFRQHFDETHAATNRNPFMCRSVFLDFGTLSEEANNQIEQFLELLHDYGQHIWHCVILYTEDEQRTGTYCRKFFEMLGLMPSLQTLSLNFCFQGIENNWQVFLITHPFPTLRHLKCLKVWGAPTCLFNALTRANPQIKQLAFFDPSGISFVSHNLPQLEDFSNTLHDEQQFRMLQNVSFVRPLTKLYLKVIQGIPTRDLFDFLKTRCSETLMALTLDFSRNVEPLDMTPLNLKNLRMFALSTKWFTPPLDFLLPTKSSLETLSLLVMHSRVPDAQERLQTAIENERAVKLLNFRNNLTESNIWSIFPKLQNVDFKDFALGGSAKPHVCRRSDWFFKQTYNV